LVYQHHFIDVWTGVLVGVICIYLIPDKPFSWRCNKPTARMKYLASRYFISAASMALAAFFASDASNCLTAFFI
jgi:hypothetical protein